MMIAAKFLRFWQGLILLVFLPLLAQAGGDEVVVVYNSRLPESKVVAEHYAAMRQVPAGQIFGFALTTNEVITRADFTDFLQKPLVAKLVAAKLWKFGDVAIPAINDQPAHTESRVVQSKIRYAVLCYGVPLKIAPSSVIDELAQKITREELRRNEAAVDSELTWLPVSRNDISLTGPLPNTFYTKTNRAALNCTNGFLLVTRLDGPTVEIANHLVDKAMEAESNGFWGRAYFDARGLDKTSGYYEGDAWILAAAEICRLQGFDVETDTNAETWRASFPMSHIAFYAGWYEGNLNGPFLDKQVEFMPGAFAYHLHSSSAESLRTTTDHWCGPLLARGATCTMGCVYEPYLQFTPNIAFFAQSFCNGWTFGESAWASEIAVSWQTTMVGDPLYQPFKKSPPVLHAELERKGSPLIEWSLNRLMNLDRARGVRASELSTFLENSPVTARSAVLTEKLAQLYEFQGKPSSAIDSWQHALKLSPSPHQRIRLHLLLAEKLSAEGRAAEAAENWRQLIADSPDYPDLPAIREKLARLEQKTATGKVAMPVFFDTHAHLDYPEYESDFSEVLARAEAAGITKIISIATDLDSSRRALALAEKHPLIYAAIGWHPGNAHEAPADIRDGLRELARHPKVVAIGECGLDYHRLPGANGGSPEDDARYKQKQAEIFQQQLEVAAETGLNCVIHQRSSFDDLFAQIQPFARKTCGVFHCFGESVERLQKILSLGWLVSYTGIVTFKNGENIREAVAATPLDKFMLETDCPYLAPVPYRGKRCEPAYVKEISETIAQVKLCSLEELSIATCHNAHKFFPKMR